MRRRIFEMRFWSSSLKRPKALLISLLIFLGLLLSATLLHKGRTTGSPTAIRNADDFVLMDNLGRSHELYRYSDSRAVVLIAQGNGCPILRQNMEALRDLFRQFAPRGVKFLMINANPQDDRESIAREAREFDIDIPILRDDSRAVVRSLGITRTGETLVIDPTRWSVVYQGAVDDRLGYGWQKPAAKRRYLAEALEALLADGAIAPAVTPVNGCLIDLRRESGLTYTHDAAPILLKKCLTCHGADGSAPTMTSYSQIKGWAPMIRETLLTHRMPPWDADPMSGKFRNDPSLDSREFRALIDWIETGTARGVGKDPLADITKDPSEARKPPGNPDIVFSLRQADRIPASGPQASRTLPLLPRVPRDLWVSGVTVLEANRRVVAHTQVVAIPGPPAQHADDDPDLGGQVESIMGVKHQYQVDVGPTRMLYRHAPEGTAVFIPKGASLFLVAHNVPSGMKETDNPKVGLYLYRGKDRPWPLRSETLDNPSFNIPPGAKEFEVSAERVIHEDIRVWALWPHMHSRGARIRFEARYPDGRSETLLSVPKFTESHQVSYEFKRPISLPAGTRLLLRGAYDNSARNLANPDPTLRVEAGQRPENEMLQCYIYYSSGRAKP
ncbi:MAG: redoxin domain-containing protein [Elusimicrobia bacterium]|nr:redoxin domain-containing protein [Elusimicrobiota bacterium]